MKAQKNKTLLSFSSEAATFACKRIPNFQEALVTSVTQATIDTVLGRVKLFFGDNPTAPAIIRDISKIPSIYANVYQNNTIGYTETQYDEGNLYAHGIKTVCKAVILSGYKYTYLTQGLEFSQAARLANYICEIPNRYLIIMAREKQNLEKLYEDQSKKTFLDFVFNDEKSNKWSDATGEAFVKTTISDQLGEGIKYISYVHSIRKVTTIVDNYILNSFGGNSVNFMPKVLLYLITLDGIIEHLLFLV